MSAAVARQQQQSGHGGSNNNAGSRIGSNSPTVERRVKTEDKSTKSPTQNQREIKASPKNSHKHSSSLSSTTTLDPPQVAVDQPPDPASNAHSSNQQNAGGNHVTVLPPPPPADMREQPGDDYFNFHRNRLDQEPNPFEQSFSVQGDNQKTVLPPASAITSPAPLIGGQAGFGFMNSLRSGPLSPAMLQGPISSSNSLGFDTHIRTGLTPNESGIRSGLTPGGSGSMFPVSTPSPASFFQLGNATPSTMEFQKTAISAAALRKHQQQQQQQQQQPSSLNSLPPPPLTKTEYPIPNDDTDHSNVINKPRQLSSAFDTDPAHHAANGLYMLAQAHHQQGDPYPSGAAATGGGGGGAKGPTSMTNGHVGTSPGSRKRSLITNNSMTRGGGQTTGLAGNVRGMSEMSDDMGSDSDDSDDDKRGGKNGDKGTLKRVGSIRRKATDSKGSTSKRAKGNQGQAMSAGGSGDEMGSDEKGENQLGPNGKKMTDEEKRKNFLERNRVAALKCRQRKKQWLQNLQQKVELYSQENENLSAQVSQLREEIVALKTLLLAHKDCPIAQRNDMAGMAAIHSTLAGQSVADYGAHAATFAQMNVMPPQVHGHSRRYS